VSLLVIILQVIVFKEVISLRYTEAKEKNLWGFRTLHWVLLFATFFYFYGDFFLLHSQRLISIKMLDSLHRYHLIIAFTLYVIAFLGFIVTFKKGLYKYQLGQIAWTVLMLLNVVVQSQVILTNIFNGLFWFVFPCTLIIMNDCAAYFWGLTFGRRFFKRPLTSLSPNKTWEGFIGALFTTIIYAFFGSRVWAQFNWFICPKEYSNENMFGSLDCIPSPIFVPTDFSIPSSIINLLQLVGIESTVFYIMPVQLHAIVLALFASLIAPFGGFFASAVKRAYGIKDFSSFIPGHGGVTDRMDCQFIMGLFVYVYYTAFVKISLHDFNEIAFSIQQLTLEDQNKLYTLLGLLLEKQ